MWRVSSHHQSSSLGSSTLPTSAALASPLAPSIAPWPLCQSSPLLEMATPGFVYCHLSDRQVPMTTPSVNAPGALHSRTIELSMLQGTVFITSVHNHCIREGKALCDCCIRSAEVIKWEALCLGYHRSGFKTCLPTEPAPGKTGSSPACPFPLPLYHMSHLSSPSPTKHLTCMQTDALATYIPCRDVAHRSP